MKESTASPTRPYKRSKGLAAMDEHGGLRQRVRDALAVMSVVREVNMFGGRAFMVNEKMLVSVGRDGELLVRVDPERSEELLAVAGARQAEMGAERSMGNGWITVAEQAVATDKALAFWISVATAFNEKATGWGSSRRRRAGR